MIRARARVRPPMVLTDANDGPGRPYGGGDGCGLKFLTAFVNFSGISRCWANPHYYARPWVVSSITRWGYVEVHLPIAGFRTKLVPITAPIIPGAGGWGTTADGSTEIIVRTFPDAYQFFGAGGLAVIADLQIRARIIAAPDGGQAYSFCRVVCTAANGRWVNVLATGFTAADYGNPNPGDSFGGITDDVFVCQAERYLDCNLGYQIVLTPGEITPSACPVSGAAPGWIGEPTPATTVGKPFAVSGVAFYAV